MPTKRHPAAVEAAPGISRASGDGEQGTEGLARILKNLIFAGQYLVSFEMLLLSWHDASYCPTAVLCNSALWR